MGGGSFGMSKSRSGSTATEESTGYGYTGSTSSDVSQSLSQSQSAGQSTSTQGIAFEDLFKQLYGGATGAAANATMGAPQLTQTAQQLFTGGTDFLNTLSSGGAGGQYLEQRLQGNPQLQSQIDLLGEDINKFYGENVNTRIRGNAVSGGTLGGGRQGVAEGAAAEAAGRQFTQGAAQLRAADLEATDNAAAQFQTAQNQAAATGLSALPGLFGLAQSGNNAELDVYGTLSQILGGPTTLTQQQSTDFSTATSAQIAEAFSRAFGENFSQSKGTSSSFGRSNAFNMSGYVGVGG